jgi:hypothetical protein
MSIQSIFDSLVPGLNGITLDVYTGCIAMVGVLVVACGIGVVQSLLLGDREETSEGGAFSESEFNDFAVKKYKRELYEKTYAKRGIGKVDDMGGGL